MYVPVEEKGYTRCLRHITRDRQQDWEKKCKVRWRKTALTERVTVWDIHSFTHKLHVLHTVTTIEPANIWHLPITFLSIATACGPQRDAPGMVFGRWGPWKLLPPPPRFSVVLTQASQVAFARRKLKQATLNEPSCLCLLSVWHMKDMWLCETWRPYQAHARQNGLAWALQF